MAHFLPTLRFLLPARKRTASLALLVVAALSATPEAQSPTAFERGWRGGSPASLTGTVTVVYGDDFVNGRSDVAHWIRDERTGERFTLNFQRGAPEGLRTGQRVTVEGRADGHQLYLADGGSTVLTAASSQPTTVIGDQKTLVIVANFNNVSVTCSIASITDIMFTDPNGQSVDAVYRDNSNDCVSFSGTVVGPYTINFSSTGVCDPAQWADAAEAAAAAAGVNTASYARKVYVLPQNSCPMSGYGSVGGATGEAWVFGCSVRRIYQHELGHNLGMMHASSPGDEYGDNTDPMGIYFIPRVFGFNSPHRLQMGWLPDTSIQTISESGLYEIAPLGVRSASATAPQALLIRKPDTGEQYVVSYRFPVGYDSNIDGLYFYRSTVHRYWPGPTAFNTYILAGLADSETFADSINGVVVTQVAHDSTRALVRVELSHVCNAAAPTVSITPSIQDGSVGTRLTYAVSIVNNDSTTCPPSTFTLNGVAPSGWTLSVSPASLTLGPGASGNATLTLTSPIGTGLGRYDAVVNVSDGATASHIASGAVSYSVIGDTTAPTAPTNLKATTNSKKKQIQLAWTAATDSNGVAGYIVERNGVAVGSSLSTTWIDSAWSAGSTLTYFVIAYDAAGNRSPRSNSATLTLAGGGKGR